MKTPSPIIDPEALRSAAGKAVSALKVLANADRLLLLSSYEYMNYLLVVQVFVRTPLGSEMGATTRVGLSP